MSRPPLHLVRDGVASLSAYRPPATPPPVKLDANESPWPLPTEARAMLGDALAALPFQRYPDPTAGALKDALARHLDATPESLVVGCGSDEIIALLYTALCRPRATDKKPVVVYPGPTFIMYEMNAITHGLEPVEVPLTDRWTLDETAMREALAAHQPNLVFYASPNNPTGNRFDDAVLARLIEAAPDALHVIDEAYGPFSDTTLGSWCARYPQVGVMSTLSKVGLAAARIGWIRVHPDLATELEKVRQPFNLSMLAQEVGRLALTDLAPVLETQRDAIVQERQRLFDALTAMEGLEVFPSEANFLFARVDGDAQRLVDVLRQDGIAIRGFAKHGGRLAGHVRISVGTPKEDDRFLAALPSALAAAR